MMRDSLPSLSIRRQLIRTVLGTSLLLIAASPVLAHEGHDHGAPEPAPLPVVPATAKFVATSEDFEVVGVLSSAALTLYLDDARTNAPIDGAVLDVVADGQPGLTAKAERQAPGTYRLALKSPLPAGTYALTLGIESAQGSDLLTAKLVNAPTIAAESRARVTDVGRLSWTSWGGGALILAVGGVVALIIKRRRVAQRSTEKHA